MKFLLFLLIQLCAIELLAQNVVGNDIVIGKTDSLYSRILKEKRAIWIYLPPWYNDPSLAGKRFPVIFLLDGGENFSSVSAMVDKLSADGITTFPQSIVVGILNTDRMRDLTPTKSPYNGLGKITPAFQTSGGGENFSSFIEKELIPHIDSLYPTAPHRTLIGHSLGGLSAIDILIHHPTLFNAYVAIDPSMWWDNQWMLKQAQELFRQKKLAGRSLYLAIANTLPSGTDIQSVRKDTTIATKHIRSLLELRDLLLHYPESGIQWTWKFYPDDSHYSLPLTAEYDALRYLFSSYRMSPSDELKFKDREDGDIVALLNNKYALISKQTGYKVFPVEGEINGMGWFYFQMNWPKKALQMFELNILNHPQSSNAYENMGDYYHAQNNTIKATEFYEIALKVCENSQVRKKLNELIGKK